MNPEITSRVQVDFFQMLSCALLICFATLLTQKNADAQSNTQPQVNAVGEKDHSDNSDAGLGQLRGHRHEPVIVRSKPVIERLPVSVIEPVDIVSTESGMIYVADRGAETVFRLSADGHVDAPVKNTRGIIRIAVDSSDNIYTLIVESNVSRILHFTPTGLSVEVATFPFEATAMVRLTTGEFLVNSKSTRTLTMSSPDSGTTLLATLPEAITDIALSSSGQVHVLHSTGRISYVGLDGGVSEIGRVTAGCARLFSLPEGQLAALSPERQRSGEVRAGVRAEIQTAVRFNESTPIADSEVESEMKPHVYATVPQGTAAVAFDRLGNVSMVNPGLRAVTRVTTTFMVPCPHCGKPTRLILSPEGPAAPKSRSF
ncbi:MAG: hypothetical protein JNL58_26250 [Planctomyces sp.]|nr:hypothetical protein [Planctomyces sp.]